MALLCSENFIVTGSGSLKAALVSWDTEIFGYPVAQIEHFKILDSVQFAFDYKEFESWRDINLCKLVSCRLAHDQLYESIFLEKKGFRFIESVLHPKFEKLLGLNISNQGLQIMPATENDLLGIQRIASTAFSCERFHVDPRLDPELGNMRYTRWVSNTLTHPRQRLLKILDNEVLVAFFIVEVIGVGHVYWHLTAVSPDHQGKGYGRRAWLAMLRHHQSEGYLAVSTTISVRNIPVLNLYSSLNFSFLPPEMTFHWMPE